MESSTVLAFRIFVMLSCLIIVPMAAIFGSAFPDVVKTVLVDRIVAWGTGKPLEATKATPDEPALADAPTAPGTGPARTGGNTWEAPRWPMAGATPAAQPPAGSNSGVVAAGAPSAHLSGANQSASFAAPADPRNSAQAVRAAGPDMPVHTVSVENPGLGRQPGTMPAGAAAGQSGARPLDQADRFTLMERRLREYGATYYLLETWGNEGELYRFHCRMAISNNPNYTRQFEATDRDALKAMAQVLERVEAWRAGRLQ
jgi:hypothetical protein